MPFIVFFSHSIKGCSSSSINALRVVTTTSSSDRSCDRIIEEELSTDGDDGGFIHLDPLYGESSKIVTIAAADFMGSNSLMIDDHHLGMEDNNSFNEVHELDPQISSIKEIISYQRFGKIDKKVFTNLNFKCHLCGFGCAIRETLLKHFDEEHPI